MKHALFPILLALAVLPPRVPLSARQQVPRAAERPWYPRAPQLPPPTGEVIRVADAAELTAAVERVKPGGTILLADGIYHPQPFEVRTDRVTLRGESGKRDRVILDGDFQGELLRIGSSTGVTIADLTVQNVRWNGIKLNTDSNVQQARIYNCIVRNVWQRFVKGVIVPPRDRERIRPRGCRIEYCLFYNERPKRYEDDPADTEQNFRGNYIGGIDVMYAQDWTISDNVFVGIHGRTGEGRGAVFLWNDCRGCVVERNIIVDCDAGICLGNSSKGEGVTVHCTNCVVRNNFLTRVPENGILADYTRECRIVHNSVYDPQSRLGRLIRLVHDNDGMMVANNLLCGPDIRIESSSSITFRNNLAKDLTGGLIAPAEGNLRLTERAVGAIDRGSPLPDVKQDIDRHMRGQKPDIGAHELR